MSDDEKDGEGLQGPPQPLNAARTWQHFHDMVLAGRGLRPGDIVMAKRLFHAGMVAAVMVLREGLVGPDPAEALTRLVNDAMQQCNPDETKPTEMFDVF